MHLLRELLQRRFRFGDGIGVVAVKLPDLTIAPYGFLPFPNRAMTEKIHLPGFQNLADLHLIAPHGSAF